jgi:6-phosphofructokinase 1
VLTGGGDAPGVNAVVRAFVHAATRRSIDVLGCRYGLEGLLADDIAPLGIEGVRGLLPLAGSALGCSTRVNPFFVPCDGGGTRDEGPAIVARLRARGVEALVMIGGDGTMLAARRFTELDMPCIGVPKTIDNDLGETDVTVGFDSAVHVATAAVDALHATAEAHARVMIVETMGRNAGFIALQAGVAGGADVVLLPELPYRVERVVAKIRERESLGRRFTIVVVAEGARPYGGDVLATDGGKPGSLPHLGGAGARLVHELEAADTGHEVRLTVLGHLQRGASPTPRDRNLGTAFGALAAELCERGEVGRMIAVRSGALVTAPLPREDRLHKRVAFDDRLVVAAGAIGVELGDAWGASQRADVEPRVVVRASLASSEPRASRPLADVPLPTASGEV